MTKKVDKLIVASAKKEAHNVKRAAKRAPTRDNLGQHLILDKRSGPLTAPGTGGTGVKAQNK